MYIIRVYSMSFLSSRGYFWKILDLNLLVPSVLASAYSGLFRQTRTLCETGMVCIVCTVQTYISGLTGLIVPSSPWG